MSELSTALLSSALGGAIALGGVFFAGQITSKNDLRSEKREKLEQIMEQALMLQACTSILMENKESTCDDNQEQFRLVTLSYLYFPELKKHAAAHSSAYLSFKVDLSKCPLSDNAASEGNSRITCLDQVTSASKLPDTLQAIATEIEKIARTLE